jgi:prolyl oligopeptidase
MLLSPHALEPVTEVLHGVTVVDPFRWLEDRDRLETTIWIAEQQRRHDDYFSQLGGMNGVRARVEELLDVETVEQPEKLGDRVFYRRRCKGQEQACICIRTADGEARVLVDPAEQGVYVAVLIHQISDDGRFLAYSLKRGGERTEELHFVDLDRNRILDDFLPTGIGRGIAFASDKQGVYYCHELPEAVLDQKPHEVRYHRFGDLIDQDSLLISVPRTKSSRMILTSDSVNLGVLFAHDRGTEAKVDLYLASRTEDRQWRPVLLDKTLPYSPFLHNGRIYAISFRQEPNGKIVELQEDGSEGETIVPAFNARINNLRLAEDRLYVSYKIVLALVIHCWTFDGEFLGALPQQPEGSFALLPSSSGHSSTLFFSHESFSQPPSILSYDQPSSSYIQLALSASTPYGDRQRVERISYPSKDGTPIPMWLVSLETTDRRGPRPTILTGYGAAGVSMTPRFSVLVTVMLELGCVFALPNIRGGAEFGREWHEAACRGNRQVAYDDFLAAAEWLRENNVARPEQLGIFGGSNSGLLVAVAMTQRPDLFSAVLCLAPILDMVRYEKFGDARKWMSEHGTVDDPDEFRALYAYSPYHRVVEHQNYPATLFVTGDKDGQCDPAHTRKMAARLQTRDVQSNPILVDYNRERGHSAVLPLSVRIEALTRRIAFLCKELGISIQEEEGK